MKYRSGVGEVGVFERTGGEHCVADEGLVLLA